MLWIGKQTVESKPSPSQNDSLVKSVYLFSKDINMKWDFQECGSWYLKDRRFISVKENEDRAWKWQVEVSWYWARDKS